MYSSESPEHYWRASKILYNLNMSLPPDARLDDMPPIKLHDHTYQSMLHSEAQAMEYCDEWSPVVMSSLAIYRKEMLDKLGNEG